MIRRYNNTGLAVGVPGLIIQIIGIMMGYQPVILISGTALLIIGLAYYAKAKGHSPAWCIMGLLPIIGIIIVACLNDIATMTTDSQQNSVEAQPIIASGAGMTDATADLASRGQRLGGALIDLLILAAITVPLVISFDLVPHATIDTLSVRQRIVPSCLWLVVYLIINSFLLSNYGQTVGKKLMRIRIVRVTDGNVPPLSTLFLVRYVIPCAVGLTPILGGWLIFADYLFIFRANKRCLHDLIAGTKVVQA